MDRYIGVDVHLESSTFAVMGSSGKRLREQLVETNERAMCEFVRSVGGKKHLCLEEGELSEWLYKILAPLVDEIAVIQPERRTGNKSDAHDAWVLADLMRTKSSSMRRVYKAPDLWLGLRDAVHAQIMTTRDASRAKNRLRAIFRWCGIRAKGEEIYDAKRREAWIEQLPERRRRIARLLSKQLDDLKEAANEANAWLEEEARRNAAVQLIATAPGIRVVRASQIVARVLAPGRFRTKRQFWSYCGLGVVTRSSSDWARDKRGEWIRREAQPRGLNKNRSPLLKQVFNGAAMTVIRQSDHPLTKNYRRLIEAGTRPSSARLTMARRIAAAVLAMWKHGEVYNPERHKTDRTA